MIDDQKIAAVIPALNEEVSIGRVVGALKALTYQGVRVIDVVVVCDNGSTDQTTKKALDAGAVVTYESVQGYGSACLRALASVGSVDIVLFLNGDESEDVSEALSLLLPCVEHYDFVVGHRVAEKRECGAMLPQQVFGGWLATQLIRSLWGHSYHDLGPFRSIRLSALRQLAMQDKNYGWTIEMQIKAIICGLRILEVPVSALKGKTPSCISGTLRGCIGVATKIFGYVFYYKYFTRAKSQSTLVDIKE